MCYLSIKLLKYVIAAGSFLSIILGLLAIALALFFFFENIGIWAPSQSKYRDLLASIIAISGLVSFVAGVLGFMGANRKSKWMLSLYSIISIIMFLVFLGTAITMIVLPATILNESCPTSDEGWMKDMRHYTQIANESFCRMEYCYIKRDFNSSQQRQLDELGFKGSSNINNPVKVQNTSSWPKNATGKLVAQFMESLETFFKCTGWCQTGFYFTFSDVNQKPKQWEGCFLSMKRFIVSRGKLIGGICVGIGLAIGVNVLLICCLLKHPNNQYEQSYYQRFIVHADQ